MSSTMAFAWSISGKVQSAGSGRALAGVAISSFNYPGVATTSAEDGSFSLSNEGNEGIVGINGMRMSASINGGIFSLENVSAHQLKISVINALGKVTYQRAFYEINGFVSIDLAKATGNSASFVRISADGANQTYIVKGKNALLKEGDPLAVLMFVLDGYQSYTYNMQAEVETNVVVKMERGSATQNSSSSVVGQSSSNTATQSSAEVKSSSSQAAETPVDCSGKTLKSNTTLKVDGRDVIVKFPSGYKGDKPVPLLINYHPIGGSASQWESGSGIAKEALADGAIAIFPDGQGGAMMMGRNAQAWNVGPCCTDADDVTFSRDFIKELTEKACVDPKRIYAAGFSMGGGMSNYAGCFLADLIAAAAPSAFDLAKEIVDAGKCKPARPYPILNFRGTADNIVMYEGGLSKVVEGKPITFMGAKDNMKEWAKMNGCKDASPKQNTPGNGCEMYEDCEGGAKVGLCTINGGSHAEGDAKMAWQFLKQFSLP